MALIGLIIFAVILFVLVGLPIWAIIDCAISKEKSNGAKAGWIILIILTWSLGAIIYGLVAPTRKSLRWSCIVSFIITILLAAGFFSLFNWLSKDLHKDIDQSRQQLATVDTTVLNSQETGTLKSNLTILEQEAKDMNHMTEARELIKYFKVIIKDNKIETQEYQEWHKKFELRKTNLS